jgi:hypothetical protein
MRKQKVLFLCTQNLARSQRVRNESALPIQLDQVQSGHQH